MDNLDDLKAVWHTAKTDSLPSSGEMVRLIRKFRGQKLRNKWLVIVISLLLCILFIAILFIFPFKLISSFIGGGLMALGSLVLALTNIRSLKRFYQLDDSSNLEFIAFIEQTRKNQLIYYRKTIVFIMLSYAVGYILYAYELTWKHPSWFVGVYAVMSIYCAIMWFIVRPRAYKKGAAKLDAMQTKHENILKQLK